MSKEQLIKNLNIFLKDTKYEFFLCGSFDRPVDELEPNEKKYIIIISKENRDTGYMDWHYEEFSECELKKYADEIPNEQGSGDDEISNEYKEIGELIMKYFKTN